MATAPKTQRLDDTIPEPDQQVSHPFSEPSVDSDLILLVEEQKFYVNKVVLSLSSPVFKTMFEADFKEKSSEEITLPNKTFGDMLEFLLCFYPSTCRPITMKNLDAVLPLAHEYQMEQIVARCEEFVLNRFQNIKEEVRNPPLKELVHFLVLAEMYGLNDLHGECIEKMACRGYTCRVSYHYSGDYFAENEEEFKMVSCKTRCEILLKRMRVLEPLARDGLNDQMKQACFAINR